MSIVHLAAQERLTAAFGRYEVAYAAGVRGPLLEARIELCEALVAAGEELAPEVVAQLERDRAELEAMAVIQL